MNIIILVLFIVALVNVSGFITVVSITGIDNEGLFRLLRTMTLLGFIASVVSVFSMIVLLSSFSMTISFMALVSVGQIFCIMFMKLIGSFNKQKFFPGEVITAPIVQLGCMYFLDSLIC